MIKRHEHTPGQDGPGRGKKAGAAGQAGAGEDACRCRETSKMTPRQLLGLMMSDLAFWKKTAKKE